MAVKTVQVNVWSAIATVEPPKQQCLATDRLIIMFKWSVPAFSGVKRHSYACRHHKEATNDARAHLLLPIDRPLQPTGRPASRAMIVCATRCSALYVGRLSSEELRANGDLPVEYRRLFK